MKVLAVLLAALGWLLAAGGPAAAGGEPHVHTPTMKQTPVEAPGTVEAAVPAENSGCSGSACRTLRGCCAGTCVAGLPASIHPPQRMPAHGRIDAQPAAIPRSIAPDGLLRPPRSA